MHRSRPAMLDPCWTQVAGPVRYGVLMRIEARNVKVG
jgi:hypothetical protein